MSKESMVRVKRALISVSDKSGVSDFARGLTELGVEILSTGGTAKLLEKEGIKVIRVSDFTGFPEMLDGRVKTLHPRIHGGLLALRENPEHMQQVKEHKIGLIDLVVVNLYPFEATIKKEGVTLEEAIENIDIGGPSMLRSAAKNSTGAAVICNPASYGEVLEELKANDGCLSGETCFRLAVEVFNLTSRYDRMIYQYLAGQANKPGAPAAVFEQGDFPEDVTLNLKKIQDLRYGENPHQKACYYRLKEDKAGIARAKQLHGKGLSFNNIIDLESAWAVAQEFDEPAAGVIKHNNPCGAATAETLDKAYEDALACDPLSAFGSIVGLNRKVDTATAAKIGSADFVECVIAPGYEKEALEILTKKKNLRLMEMPEGKEGAGGFDLKKVSGGILIQDKDREPVEEKDLKVATKTSPTPGQIKSLLFADKIAKHVKSNTIVLVQGTKTVGIGAGQMSRVDSVIIACRKAGDKTKGAVMASDAFFPKSDAVETAAKAGVAAIIQPGGSIRDDEAIAAADKTGISMVLSGKRHFRH